VLQKLREAKQATKENQFKKQRKNQSGPRRKNQYIKDNSTGGYDEDLEDLEDCIEVMLRYISIWSNLISLCPSFHYIPTYPRIPLRQEAQNHKQMRRT
jgi:hypothetical protein